MKSITKANNSPSFLARHLGTPVYSKSLTTMHSYSRAAGSNLTTDEFYTIDVGNVLSTHADWPVFA